MKNALYPELLFSPCLQRLLFIFNHQVRLTSASLLPLMKSFLVFTVRFTETVTYECGTSYSIKKLTSCRTTKCDLLLPKLPWVAIHTFDIYVWYIIKSRQPRHIVIFQTAWKLINMDPGTRNFNEFPLDKMAVISQTIFSNSFSWMTGFIFWFELHGSWFINVQLTRSHWFR